MDQELDLRVYFAILRRWWWLLALGLMGGAAGAFLLSSTMTPLYRATAKVLVERAVSPGTPSSSDITASQQLAATFSELIKTRPILEQVVDTLALPYGAGALAGKISVTSPRSLMQITVTDPNPKIAADIANATAQTFIDDFRDKQFLQIAQFQASLANYGITQDPSIIAAQAATMGVLRVAEPAAAPGSPFSPRTRFNVLLGGVLGFLVSGTFVLVLAYLDNGIKSPDEIKALTGLTTLGSVLRYPSRDGLGVITIGDEHTHSNLTEAYKFLRTNLQFAALGSADLKSVLITSSSPGEGKTTTAANLAIAIAREGKSVILVDADLRKPALHGIFGIEGHKGLTNIILGDATVEEALASTAIEGLQVLTSGPVPPDATVVLQYAKMKEVVEQLKRRAEMVVFDSPPILAVTDPMLLVPLVDATLLVVDMGSTGRDVVRRAAQELARGNPAFAATVLNKISPKGRGGYYYYYYYYYGESNGRQRRKSRTHARKLFQPLRNLLRVGKSR
ncbi:MAG: polysaccharide biosynthesis tyrosine autokinase [Chloroflexota bacterium]